MPLYEYRCQACGAEEERLQAISAPDHHDCPECEAPGAMKRQVSVAAFALAGGGWYKQGYGGAAAAKTGTEGGGDAAKPAAAGPAPAAAPAPAAEKAASPAKPAGGCAGGCACH